jgi:surface antigen
MTDIVKLRVESMNGTQFAKAGLIVAMTLSLSACGTTSGSTRLDDTGNRIAAANGYDGGDESPADSSYYIRALRGGLLMRMAGLKLSTSDKTRALEAEYKALESAPSGQSVVWDGSGLRGQVTVAVPYQVGSQNCRQYTHTVIPSGGQPVVARGAACRNPNGSWTPLA